MISTTVMIALQEAQHAIKEGDTLEEQIKAAMRATKDHWLATDEDERFKAAVGAVMNHYGAESEVFARLKWEMRILAQLGTAIQGASLGMAFDWEGVLSEPTYEPIGLLGMWKAL